MPARRRLLVLCAVLALAFAAPAAAYQLQPGIGFVAVTGSTAGAELILEDALHQQLASGNADAFGSFIFRDLTQGGSYFVTETGGSTTAFTVLRFEDHPAPAFYQSQTLVEGLNYIQMRDGTLLAAMVRAPLNLHITPGTTYPTVIEYSGYAAADPDNPQPSTAIAQALGYATVGVNMRGSGCSGGVLDLFDYPTTADGYDVVEAVAAQSWVKDNQVGMVGISFPGISQIFVAGAQPPHLEAVAPFSVIADIYRAPGFPGGIFNNGFSQTWLQERADDAQPAPAGGQAWAITRVNNGDSTCLANQTLRLQTQDPVAFTEAHPYYTPPLMDQRSPINWISKIQVPMLLSGAFQDEQTGPGFAPMLASLPKSRDVKVLMMNGVHSSPLEPEGLYEWIAFLDIFVGKHKPDPTRVNLFASIIYDSILGSGTPTPPMPPNRFAGAVGQFDGRAIYEAQPTFRVLMENGAGTSTAGLPAPRFEIGVRRWPPPHAKKTKYYLGSGGILSPKRENPGGIDTYNPDPTARPMQTLPGQGQSDSWEIMPAYDWRSLVAGTGLAYATAPLPGDVVVVGPGSVDLWLRSSASDTDLQVTLTEVRPDGLEAYVQSGWLRASHRKLDPSKRQSPIEPIQSHLESDAAPMPAGQFELVRVPLMASAHVFRAGSRIRISIEAPGGDRTRWAFDTFLTNGTVVNEIAHTPDMPSRVVLPVIRHPVVPAGLAPCPGLRGQPCRTYVAASNGG